MRAIQFSIANSFTNLHRNQLVVDHDFFSEEIRSYCGLVLVGEFLGDILIHEGSFPNAEKIDNVSLTNVTPMIRANNESEGLVR